MKVIIAGSRSIHELSDITEGVKLSGFNITEEITGDASGADWLGELWAKQNNIPIKHFPANWNLHGKAAGPIRNQEMGDYCDAAVIIWDGISKGSKSMISIMKKLGKPFYVHKVKI